MSASKPSSIQRRRFLSVVSGGAASLALAGCGDSTSQQPTPDSARPDAGADGAATWSQVERTVAAIVHALGEAPGRREPR